MQSLFISAAARKVTQTTWSCSDFSQEATCGLIPSRNHMWRHTSRERTPRSRCLSHRPIDCFLDTQTRPFSPAMSKKTLGHFFGMKKTATLHIVNYDDCVLKAVPDSQPFPPTAPTMATMSLSPGDRYKRKHCMVTLLKAMYTYGLHGRTFWSMIRVLKSVKLSLVVSHCLVRYATEPLYVPVTVVMSVFTADFCESEIDTDDLDTTHVHIYHTRARQTQKASQEAEVIRHKIRSPQSGINLLEF